MVKKVKLRRKKSNKAVRRTATMDTKSKRWRIYHPKYKKGIYLLKSNNKQITPYARELLREHSEEVNLPPNFLYLILRILLQQYTILATLPFSSSSVYFSGK